MLLDLLGEHDIAFHLETNDKVGAGALGGFFAELEVLARTAGYFGPEAHLRVKELRTGSVDAILEVAANGVTVLGVTTFALGIADRIRNRRSTLGKRLAEMMLDDHVVSCEIATQKQKLTFRREDVPAVAALEERRLARTSGHMEADHRRVSPAPLVDRGLESAKMGRFNDPHAADNAGDLEGSDLRPDRPVNLIGKFTAARTTGQFVFTTQNGTEYQAQVAPALRAVVRLDQPVFASGSIAANSTSGDVLWVEKLEEIDNL